jgi:hypothetical protein
MSRQSAKAEISLILGQSKITSLSAAFDDAIDLLITSGRPELAADLYLRHSAAINEPVHISSTAPLIADYSRDKIPHRDRRPMCEISRDGNAIVWDGSPIAVSEDDSRSVKKQISAALNLAKGDTRIYASNAERQKAYRARRRAALHPIA